MGRRRTTYFVLLGTLALAGPALTAVQFRDLRAPMTLASQIGAMILGADAPPSIIGLRDFGVRQRRETAEGDGVSRSPLFAFQSREPEVAAAETSPAGITSPHAGTVIGDVASLTYGMSTLAASCKLTAMSVGAIDPERLYALARIGREVAIVADNSARLDLPAAARPAVFPDHARAHDGLVAGDRSNVPLRLGDGDQLTVHRFRQVSSNTVTVSDDGMVDGNLMGALFRPNAAVVTDSFEYADAYLWRRAINGSQVASSQIIPLLQRSELTRSSDFLSRARRYLAAMRRQFEMNV